MKSTVENLEGNKVKLSVELEAGEFEAALDDAFRRIAKEVRLPGFRPGKAPRKVLEAKLGKGFARGEALQQAVPDYYVSALREHSVDAIAAPEIDITSGQEDGPVVFDAVVEIRPTVTVAGYAGLRVEIDNPEPTDDEIEEQIDRLRAQFAELVDVDRPIADGDHVTIDINGEIDGEAVSGLTATDYLYEVGSGAVVPEIDENLRGAGVDDELEFEADHPDPDEEAVLSFRILVKQVQEKQLPELTDEFVADASEFETVEELRDDVVTRIGAVKKTQARVAVREKTAEALAELVIDEVPKALVDNEVNARIQDLANRLRSQGATVEQYFSMTGQDPQDFVEQLREPATTSAKIDLGLRAVVSAEGLEATEEELDEELVKMAEQTGDSIESVRHHMVDNDHLPELQVEISKRKAVDWLLERVTIVDTSGATVEWESLAPTPPPAADGDTTDHAVAAEGDAAGSDENEGTHDQ